MTRIDVWVAGISLVGLPVLSWFLLSRGFHPIYTVACAVAAVCLVAYLVMRNKLETADGSQGRWWANYVEGAFLCIVLSITFYVTRQDASVEPLGYYVTSAVAVSLIFAAALCIRNRVQTVVTLLLVGVVGMMHLWTTSLMFPSVIGLDAWTHLRVTTQELGVAATQPNGYQLPPVTVTTLGGYYSLMHLYISKMMGVFHLDYKMATLIFWSSSQVVGNVIFAYLIGKELFNRRIAVVAALMLTVANWALFFIAWAIPNSSGVTLSLVAAWAGIKWHQTHKPWFILLIAGALGIGFLTHVITSIWIVGTTACVFVVPQLIDNLHAVKRRVVNTVRVCILPVALIAAFIVWIEVTPLHLGLYSVTAGGTFDPASTSMTYAVGKAPPIIMSSLVSEHWAAGSLLESSINSMGMFLYLGLAVIGCLLISRQQTNRALVLAWVILCVSVLAIGFVPPLFGISLIEHRWFYLAEAFMSIPLAVILVAMANISRRTISLVGVSVLVGIIAFLSTIGLPYNLTNRTLSANQITRYGLTAAEMDALPIAESYNPKMLGADPYYAAYIYSDVRWEYLQTHLVLSLERQLLSADFSVCPADVLILRKSLDKEPLAYGSGAIYELKYNPIDRAESQGYTQVWENDEVCVLRK